MVNTSLAWDGADNQIPVNEEDANETPSRFFTIDGNYDGIFKSAFDSGPDAGQEIGYQQGDIDISHTRVFNGCEGIGVGLGYDISRIGWNQNPFFSKQNFEFYNLTINGFTKRFNCWDIRGSLGGSFDPQDFFSTDYSFLNLVLWGRYNFCNNVCPDFGVHFGFVGRCGTKQNRFLPILGFDYRMNNKWKLNVIYPVNMSAIYSLDDTWSVAFTGKIWNTRHRVAKSEALSRGIFEYKNAGAELSLNYDCGQFLSANVHLGSTLGNGQLKILDSNNNLQRKNKFGAAAYVGGGFSFKF